MRNIFSLIIAAVSLAAASLAGAQAVTSLVKPISFGISGGGVAVPTAS